MRGGSPALWPQPRPWPETACVRVRAEEPAPECHAGLSVRALLRSRLHRVILAFYLGIGLAITIFFLKSPSAQRQLAAESASDPWRQVSAPLLASSIVMLGFWVVGTRIVFSMPLDLRANWIFRVTPIPGGSQCLPARRRALFVLSVIPFWGAAAALFLSIWPWRPAAGHLVVLGLLAASLAEFCLHGAQKIPFTCSYLPGKTKIHITFWLSAAYLVALIDKGAVFERRALGDRAIYCAMLAVLGVAASVARWRTAAQANSEEGELQFEDAPAPAVLELGLHPDGGLPMDPPSG